METKEVCADNIQSRMQSNVRDKANGLIGTPGEPQARVCRVWHGEMTQMPAPRVLPFGLLTTSLGLLGCHLATS